MMMTMMMIIMTTVKGKEMKSYPCNRQWRPIGLSGFETPTYSR
jgi:hypothetical protein